MRITKVIAAIQVKYDIPYYSKHGFEYISKLHVVYMLSPTRFDQLGLFRGTEVFLKDSNYMDSKIRCEDIVNIHHIGLAIIIFL